MNSDPQLRRWYLAFNRKYFRGELPEETAVFWEPDGGHLGTTMKMPDGEFVIRIDPALRFSSRMAKIWLLHEMAHISTWNQKHRAHGRKFKEEINRLYHCGAYISLL